MHMHSSLSLYYIKYYCTAMYHVHEILASTLLKVQKI